MPPTDSFMVAGFAERYRLASFGIVSGFLIFLVTRMKTGRPADVVPAEDRQFQMHGAQVGAD